MKKYLQIIGLFWSTSIAAELEYRLNFVIASLSSVLSLVGSFFSLFLFYRTGYTFSGWSWQEAMIVLGVFTFLQGISSTFLEPNLNRIVVQVEQGTLDFVLLKPISSQFWLSFRSLSIWGVPDLVIALAILVYAGGQLNLSPLNYILAILPIIAGCIILYSLWFFLAATSIWFVKIYNVTEVLRGLLEAGRFPISAYPFSYRIFFTFVIPIVFLTTIPSETILGRYSNHMELGSSVLAILLLFLVNLFWRYALRFYTSASS